MTSVLDEHLEYLTLTGRQDLFERALAKVVRPGDRVADLGCGVGVLGMAALRAGAAKVYGIDLSDALELARESVALAGLSEQYVSIRGSTFQTSLPEPVDLIICDHVGFFGFDYGIIAMLDDARKRLLRPGGQIMPRRLRLFVAGVRSTTARKKIDPWAADPVPQDLRWLHEYAVNSKQACNFTPDDICTDAQMLGEIDLTGPNADNFAFSATLQMATDGRFDGLACWFECELAEDIWMTNSPLSPASIGRSNAFLAARAPFAASRGEPIAVSIRIRHDEHLIAWTIQPPGELPRQKLSTWASRIVAPVDLAPKGGGPLTLNDRGHARRRILELVDGERTGEQIEDEIVQLYPELFPSPEETRRFARRILALDTSG